MKCKNCLNDINPKRLELGYKICIDCSNEPKWSSVPVINHKTGNEIQIVKDPEVAAEFMAKTARVGFGTMRGISGGYKPRKAVPPQKPKEIPDKIPSDREVGRKSLPHEFEKVGEEVMEILETRGIELATQHIQTALEEKRIFGIHAKKLNEILNTIFNVQTQIYTI